MAFGSLLALSSQFLQHFSANRANMVLHKTAMVAITSAVKPGVPNRRRRVRHKIQAPAYASFTLDSKKATLDLYEIVDISEDGMAIQCPMGLQADQELNLCLDLAECPAPILTLGKVVWSSASGRAGLRFCELPPSSQFHLREWLFMNAMAGVANADEHVRATMLPQQAPLKPSYTDTLAAVSAVQREVEALGPDLAQALQLIATRAQTLVRASGAAVALATSDPNFMQCHASAGPDAPPVGAPLQVGSGFSGECVKSGISLRCDDTELDGRVDRETCRALGIRSILAVPVQLGPKSIGIIEAFSAEPEAFTENDNRVLQRLAETVLAALNRSARSENVPELQPEPETQFASTPGSVLFAAKPAAKPEEETKPASTEKIGISLPLSHLVLLVGFAVLISMALGYLTAPLIEAKLQERGRQMPTVLASSMPPKSDAPLSPGTSPTALENASFDQVRQLAEKGDPAAQNALGLRYFQGDDKAGVKLDEKEAVRWFTSAAEHGNVAAQSKLGFLYWSGRGIPKDLTKAYMWTLIACGQGEKVKDPAVYLSKDLAQVLRSQMTHDQAAVIERQAREWVERNSSASKLTAAR